MWGSVELRIGGGILFTTADKRVSEGTVGTGLCNAFPGSRECRYPTTLGFSEVSGIVLAFVYPGVVAGGVRITGA